MKILKISLQAIIILVVVSIIESFTIFKIQTFLTGESYALFYQQHTVFLSLLNVWLIYLLIIKYNKTTLL